jgi:hypothetical protein
MNLEALETSFRRDTDDQATPYLWSHDWFVDSLNEAIHEACIRGKLIFDKTTPAVCRIAVNAAAGSTYKLHESINEITYVTLEDSGGNKYQLGIKDREELDRLKPGWRECTGRPENIIRDDKTLELDSTISESYTLRLEVHRNPICPLSKDGDIPEIHSAHHLRLLDWVKHLAYAIPDTETYNPGKSEKAEAAFEENFGVRPDSEKRRDQNANRPHRNKCW